MLKFAKAITPNTDLLSAQAFIFQKHGLESSTNLIFFLLISGEGEDSFAKIRACGLNLEDILFGEEKPIPDRLDDCFIRIENELESLENMQVLLCGIKGDLLYTQAKKGGLVSLQRGQEIIHILEDGTEKLISGHLQAGDQVLLYTNSTNELLQKNSRDLSFLFEIPLEELDEDFPTLNFNQSVTPSAIVHIDYSPDQQPDEKSAGLTLTAQPPIKKTGFGVKFQPVNIQFVVGAVKNFLFRFRFLHRKLKVLIGLVLVSFIFTTIFLVRQVGSNINESKRFEDLLKSAQQEYGQAKNLSTLNPDGASGHFNNAKKYLDEALLIKPNNKQALTLKESLGNENRQVLKEFNISTWPLFLKLDLIKSGITANRLSRSLDNIVFLDQTKKTLVVTNLKTKSSDILAGVDQLGKARFAAINGDLVFVFSEDRDIIRIDVQNKKSTPVIKKDLAWGAVADAVGFANNLYILDSEKKQIWKYVPTVSGYSMFNYFPSEVKFPETSRMLIDGSVWLQYASGELSKYTSGSLDFFSIAGLDRPLGNIRSFYTADDTDNVYVLDTVNSRVVVLKKNGQYNYQMAGEKFASADDLVVDEPNKKLYLLEGNSIYQVEIK